MSQSFREVAIINRYISEKFASALILIIEQLSDILFSWFDHLKHSLLPAHLIHALIDYIVDEIDFCAFTVFLIDIHPAIIYFLLLLEDEETVMIWVAFVDFSEVRAVFVLLDEGFFDSQVELLKQRIH